MSETGSLDNQEFRKKWGELAWEFAAKPGVTPHIFSYFSASGTLSWAFLEQTPRKPFRKCPMCPIGP